MDQEKKINGVIEIIKEWKCIDEFLIYIRPFMMEKYRQFVIKNPADEEFFRRAANLISDIIDRRDESLKIELDTVILDAEMNGVSEDSYQKLRAIESAFHIRKMKSRIGHEFKPKLKNNDCS